MEKTHLTPLLQTGKRKQHRKGQLIQTLGNEHTFSMVNRGFVKRYLISKDGTQSLQLVYGPGHCFPLTSALFILLDQPIEHSQETYYYEAMTDAEIFTISGEELQAAVVDDPLIYKDLLGIAGQLLQGSLQQAENMALKSAFWRTAHQLVFIAHKYGKPTANGIGFTLPITQQDLGDNLSLNRETISRELTKLRARGLITGGRDIVITDIDKLKAIYS